MPTPTASPASSSSNEAAVMTEEVVTAPPSSPMASSSPTAMNNEAEEVTAHPNDSGVAMAVDDTNMINNDCSASPIQPHSCNDIKNDDDVEMTPREDDAAGNPMENPTAVMENDDLESSSPAPPSEQSVNTPSPTPPKEDDNKEESQDMLLLDDSMEEEILPAAADEEMKQSDAPPSAEQRRRDENHLDDTLDKLQHSISVAILAFRKEEQYDKENEPKEEAGSTTNDDDGRAYGKLREAAMEAYQTLVEYGASLDLSLEIMSPLNKRRCEKLEKIGRDLWKIIRADPDLFNDVISDVTTTNFDITTSSSLEQKRQRAIAGGYIRSISVRLIFLQYIDTRCSKGCPPTLHSGRDEKNGACNPSPKELVFGLKVLSKGGRAILQHGKNARDSHDTLSLAISCFNALSSMAQSNGEAANEMKDVLLDEAFDVYSALPNAAALFGRDQHADMSTNDEDDASTQADNSSVDWATMVIEHLEATKSFIDEHCSDALSNESKSPLKYAALQRFLPQLARLCLKQGSHLAELGMNKHAMNALEIDLAATDSCLGHIKTEKGRTHQKKNESQMLHTLEADVVVLSIESLYVLSSVLQSEGRKEDALNCLDQVETYMNEKHERDEELHGSTMNDLGSSGSDFVFSEDPIGPAKDKADIKNRSQTALAKSRRIHSREKAMLSSRKIQLFNDNPSNEDERCIDDQLRSMVELVSKREESTLVETSVDKDDILKLTLQAIRAVYIRRNMSSMSNDGNDSVVHVLDDPFRLIFDKLAKSHQLRPFVVLDKLNAILCIAYEVRRQKLEGEYQSIDQEAILLGDQFLSSFKRDNALTSDTTLFVEAKNSVKMELLKEAKEVFAKFLSHYHSWEAYEMCAKWANMLKDIYETRNVSQEHGENPVLAEVLSVLAHSLSMSGDHTEGMKMAREAWKNHKCVNNLVILFHCAAKYKQADALLEFDNALNELSTSDYDDILEHFPRFSNSCVENEAEGGGGLLLGVQERWLNLQLRSKKLSMCLEQKKACESPSGHSVLDVLSAYLDNFEHVSSSQKDKQKAESMCEYLGHIVDGVLRLFQVCRDRKEEKLAGRRRKKKIASNESSEGQDLIWGDTATQTLLGSRSQCVCCAEALWNIGQQLMTASVGDEASYDSRALAADLFAASHDFVLMSEEEEGARLGKLDYDVKYEPEKFVVPTFNGASSVAVSDTSSEFSAQCLLLSAAVTVDYLDSAGHDSSSAKSLLRRTLHRLAQSQKEFELNYKKKKARISKMIALLTLRCVVALQEDSFAFQICNDGLCAALLKLHINDAAGTGGCILKQVKMMADVALSKRMTHTDRILTKLCSELLQKSGVSVVDGISLGDLQRKMIQSAVSVEEAIGVFNEVDNVVKKEGTSYSPDDLSWFTVEAHNRAIQLYTMGDHARSKIYSTFALNFVDFSTKETRCCKNLIMNAFARSVSAQK